MDLYADNILDHYRSPRGQEAISSPTVEHKEENLSCGDELTIKVRIENDRIAEVSWSGTGCAISQAAMSMLSEDLAGMSISDIENLKQEKIYELLGVPIGPRRFKCALLGLHTLKNALRKNEGKEAQSWLETAGDLLLE